MTKKSVQIYRYYFENIHTFFSCNKGGDEFKAAGLCGGNLTPNPLSTCEEIHKVFQVMQKFWEQYQTLNQKY